MKDCVLLLRHLLGMVECPALNALSEAELAKLIYKDNIKLKHASRQRLALELEDAARDLPEMRGQKPSDKKPASALTKSLISYLLEARKTVLAAVSAYLVSAGKHTRCFAILLHWA